MFALLVHQVVGDRNRRLDQHFARPAPGAFFFQLAQDRQRQVVVGTDQAGAVAVRAGLGRGLDHAGAQALARHFHQAKAGNPPDLDAGAVVLQPLLEALFDRRIVAPFFHVDKIDHDQPGQVAQAKLAGDFLGGLEVGFQRGFLDRALFRGPARVHVDRHQRLGHADHDVAARFKLHGRVEHRRQVAFHLEAREQRQRFLVELHVLGVARHDHFHEVLGHAIAAFAFDQNFVDLLGVKIADRALDQVAFLVDLGRRDGFQRQFADLFPEPQQVFVVALDLGLGALGAGGADDQPGPIGDLYGVGDFLELLAVGGVGDLAADPAAARGVGHEHAVAPGKRKIGGERRALVAAFFLDHLHQQDLAHLDHFLDLVFARPHLARAADLFGDVVGGVVVGDVFDRLGTVGVFVRIGLLRGLLHRGFGFGIRRIGFVAAGFVAHGFVIGSFVIGGFGGIPVPAVSRIGCLRHIRRRIIVARGRGFHRGFGHGEGGRQPFVIGRDQVRFVQVDHVHAGGADFPGGDRVIAGRLFRLGFRARPPPATSAPLGRLARRLALFLFFFLGGERLGIGLFFGDQRFAVGDRDLVVVRVNFRKRQKTVAVAAVVDKGRLQRRFDPGYFCKVDIAS